ncbi:MAG: asparagine synthase (glutamine-hydrolyzing) [Clostridia bacterium]|nr:asparagine synthase (glutamine-hydrolyzing) [Clostridia bacterium]
MCGLVGKIKFNGNHVEKSEIEKMLELIIHRGPDAGDIWTEKNIGLGHRLLKIQDLSENSIQPYINEDFVMSYNGEIYNFADIKSELILKGKTFKSDGDTEVLIKAFSSWGIEKTLKKIEGCFAIALFNKKARKMYLIRDRFGIKPLHFYKDEECIVFASEIKSILANSNIRKDYNYETVMISLASKLWMDPELTFFKDIYTIEPGTYLEINNDSVVKKYYYELSYDNGINDENVAVNQFANIFEDSVRKKLISKVPIAAFLSGGIDSSLLCKVANDNLQEPLNTYTIHYNNDNDLDLNHALELVNKEKFKQHNILIANEHYMLKQIDEVIYHIEEILIDKVYISVYFNYKAAKNDGFTVVLNGQGSDEVWLGYIFNWGIFKFINQNDNIDTLLKEYFIPNMIFGNKLKPDIKHNIEKTLRDYLNRNLVKYQKDKDEDDKLNNYSIMAIRTILHNLLLQEDKLAMAHSVESRVPFVDSHKLVELSMSISGNIKIKDGREKYIPRTYGKSFLPQSIVDRKKYAFPEPPSVYNHQIKEICMDNWKQISGGRMAKEIILPEYLNSINNFSDVELWWLLVYWRFEKVFVMEG